MKRFMRNNIQHLVQSRKKYLINGKVQSFQKRFYQHQTPLSSNTSQDTVLELVETINKNPSKVKEFVYDLDRSSRVEIARALSNLKNNETYDPKSIETPSASTLRIIGLRSSLPFLGFGFVDNFLLILAGDSIDMTLGIALGMSTMAAAGIGNIISDVVGLGLGGFIEDYSAKFGLPQVRISSYQSIMMSTRMAHYTGCTIGLIVGGIIGMAPLLFIKTREDIEHHKNKKNHHLHGHKTPKDSDS